MKEIMPKFNSKKSTYEEPSNPGVENNINKVMYSMEDNVIEIIEKLRNSIENQKYASILGIDSSGRVPALLMKKVIEGIYDKNRSKSKIGIHFLNGFRNKEAVMEQLKEFFRQESYQDIKENNKKVLIVDDVLVSGSSVKPILEALRDAKIDFDLAVMSYSDSEVENPTYTKEDIKYIEKKLGTRVYYGEFGGISEVYGKKQMSGVKQSNEHILHAIPLRKQ